MPNSDLLRIGAAARLAGVSIWTLRRWADSGKIRSYLVGPSRQRRFAKADILALVREREAKAEPEPPGQEGESVGPSDRPNNPENG